MHGTADESNTALLNAASQGDDLAFDAVFERVYAELRGVARRVRGGHAGETLNTTALVHEAYTKLVPSSALNWRGRAHFLAIAARAMRQVLVELLTGARPLDSTAASPPWPAARGDAAPDTRRLSQGVAGESAV